MDKDDKMTGFGKCDSSEAETLKKTIEIDVTVTAVVKGDAVFTLVGRNVPGKKQVKDKKLTMDKGDRDVDVEFYLTDTSGNGLTFNLAKAIWASRSILCPRTDCDDAQIVNPKIEPSKLTVTDLNSDSVELGYTLVLTGTGGQVLADPIIRNDP